MRDDSPCSLQDLNVDMKPSFVELREKNEKTYVLLRLTASDAQISHFEDDASDCVKHPFIVFLMGRMKKQTKLIEN